MQRILGLSLLMVVLIVASLLAGPLPLLPQQDNVSSAPPSLGSLEITGLRRTAGGHVPQGTLKAIAAQEKLEFLDLSGCDLLRQSDYQWLADLRALRSLSLRGTGIRDSGFAHLAGLRELEELDLHDTDITQKSLPTIAAMTRLLKLSLDLSKGLRDSKELSHLAALKNLRTLTISLQGTDEEWRLLATCASLRELNLEIERATTQGLNHLSALKRLRRLRITYCPSSKAAPLAPALQLPRLETLELKWVPVGDAWAERLGGCPNLKQLHVHSPLRLTDTRAAKLAAFPGLRELSVTSAADLTDRGVEHLAKLQELRVLNLNSCPLLSDKATGHLAKLQHLRKLELACPQISDQGIRQLTALRDLEYLDISHTKATDACLPDLAKLPRLKELWIIRTGITLDWPRLEKLLPGCAIIPKMSGFRMARAHGGPALQEDFEPATKSGTVVGTRVAKGRTWIELKVEGEKWPRAFAAVWEGDSPHEGGRWDDKTLETIKQLQVGSRLRVEWTYNLRYRIATVIKIE